MLSFGANTEQALWIYYVSIWTIGQFDVDVESLH